ncbi:flippase activity-associated protein Agl23 [Halosegnis sp.]|uniref:flippase activity-associated protein Agl23 n=1 Tax=Halosegnis sp. TaxID=2864959 RepID=UPI0035D50979
MSDLRPSRTVQAVVALAVVGLLARLVFLGSRVAHFDEARVAYWTLHYLQTGEFHYRFIIHGPLVQHVGRPLFALLGPTDFAARLPVAVVGGLLPLVALWFRHRLSDVETVGVAFFLAVNPLLLYYGRFMRSTVLVAALCTVAFAAFVRVYDGFGPRYLYLGSATLALGFGAKENAVVYVLCWLGAGALVVDAKLFGGSETGLKRLGRWRGLARGRVLADGGGVDPRAGRWLGHLVASLLVFVVLFVFLYAPRGGEWVGLYDTLANPARAPEMLSTTADQVATGYGHWFGGTSETTLAAIGDQLERSVRAIGGYAAPLVALAVVGFFIERYAGNPPRQFVLGCSYWGFVSVPGYAFGTDIVNAWILANALVPLAVPAAVGLAVLVETVRDAVVSEDTVGIAAAVVLLIVVVGTVAGGAATGVYANTTSPDNALVQYAQPSQEMRPAVAAMDAAVADGGDVFVYGDGNEEFVDGDTDAPRRPACISWFRTLPLGWYLTAADASVACGNAPEELPDRLPAVVVAPADCTLERTVDCRDQPAALAGPNTLANRTDGYERYAFLHRTTGGNWFDGIVVYVDPDR